MNGYSLILFFHVFSTIGIFIALVLERMSLVKIQSSKTIEQAREWNKVISLLPKIGGASIIGTLFSGIYLTAKAWEGAPWIGPAFGSMILIALTGVILSGPGLKGLKASLGSASEQSWGDLNGMIQIHPRLWISLQIRTGLAVAVLFLMTVKPALGVALITIVGAVVLSLLPAIYFCFMCNQVSESRV